MSEMTAEEEARQRSLVRAVAREEITTLIESRQLLMEQHSHSFRWLMASLLVINSGAVVASLNSDAIEPVTKVTAGAIFAVGISLALMVAYSSQKLTNFVTPVVQERIGYWLGVLEDGELDQEADEELAGKARKVLRFRFVPEFFGWLSLVAFFLGLAVIAATLLEASVPDTGQAVELSIQSEVRGNLTQ